MSEDIFIQYTNITEDFVAFNRYQLTLLPTLMRTKTITTWVFAICIIVFLGIVSAIAHTYFLMITGIILAVVYFLHINRVIEQSTKKTIERLYREGTGEDPYRSHTIRLLDDGIMETSSVNEQKTLWAGIVRVVRDTGHTYIYIGPMTAYVIPDNRLDAGDFQAFINELNQRIDRQPAQSK